MHFESAKEFILDKLLKELPKQLVYHSVNHINDVYNAALMYAEFENVIGEDLELLLTAAAFHDSGYILSIINHEEIGCGIVKEYLPGFGYSENQIARICGMIMATKIPQSPLNKLEAVLCDSDLDYLGRDDFDFIADLLYQELHYNKVVANMEEWNRLQVKFLNQHHYFTNSAVKLRNEKKLEHLNRIIKNLENENKF